MARQRSLARLGFHRTARSISTERTERTHGSLASMFSRRLSLMCLLLTVLTVIAGGVAAIAVEPVAADPPPTSASSEDNVQPSFDSPSSSRTVLESVSGVTLVAPSVSGGVGPLKYQFFNLSSGLEVASGESGWRTDSTLKVTGWSGPGSYQAMVRVRDVNGGEDDALVKLVVTEAEAEAEAEVELKNNDEITVAFDRPTTTLDEGGLSRNLPITVNAECVDACTELSYRYRVGRPCGLHGNPVCSAGNIKVRPLPGDTIKAAGFDGAVVQAGADSAGSFIVTVEVLNSAGRIVAQARTKLEVLPALSVSFSAESYEVTELDQNQTLLPLVVEGRFQAHELTYTYTFHRRSTPTSDFDPAEWIPVTNVPHTPGADGLLVRDVPYPDHLGASFYRVTVTVQEFGNSDGPRKTATALLYVRPTGLLDVDASLLFDGQTDPKKPKVGDADEDLPFKLAITNNNSVIVEVSTASLGVYVTADERQDGEGSLKPETCQTGVSIAPGATYECSSVLQTAVDAGFVKSDIRVVRSDASNPTSVGAVERTLRAFFEIEREFSNDITITHPRPTPVAVIDVREATPSNVEQTGAAPTGTGSFIVRGQINRLIANHQLELVLDEKVVPAKFVVDSTTDPATFWAEVVPGKGMNGRQTIRVNAKKGEILIEGTGNEFHLIRGRDTDELPFAETADLTGQVTGLLGQPNANTAADFWEGEVTLIVNDNVATREIVERARRFKTYAGHSGYEFLIVSEGGIGGSLSRKVTSVRRVLDKIHLTSVPAPKSQTYRNYKNDVEALAEKLYDRSTLAGLRSFSNGEILVDLIHKESVVEVSVIDATKATASDGTEETIGYSTQVRIAGEASLKVKGNGKISKKLGPPRQLRWATFFTELQPKVELKVNGEYEGTWLYDYTFTVSYGPDGVVTRIKPDKGEFKTTKAEGSVQVGLAAEWTTGVGLTESATGPFIKVKAAVNGKLTADLRPDNPCHEKRFKYDVYPSLRVTAGLVQFGQLSKIAGNEPRLVAGTSGLEEKTLNPFQVEVYSIPGESWINGGLGSTNHADCDEQGDPLTVESDPPEEGEPTAPDSTTGDASNQNPTDTPSSQLPIFVEPGEEPPNVPCGLEQGDGIWGGDGNWTARIFEDEFGWGPFNTKDPEDYVFPNSIWTSNFDGTKRLVWLARKYWQEDDRLSAQHDAALVEWEALTSPTAWEEAYNRIRSQNPSLSPEAAKAVATHQIANLVRPTQGSNLWKGTFESCLEQLMDSSPGLLVLSDDTECRSAGLVGVANALLRNSLTVSKWAVKYNSGQLNPVAPCWIWWGWDPGCDVCEIRAGFDDPINDVPFDPFDDPFDFDEEPEDVEEGPEEDEEFEEEEEEFDWGDPILDCGPGEVLVAGECKNEGSWIESSYLIEAPDGTVTRVDCYVWYGFGAANFDTMPAGIQCPCGLVCPGGGLVANDPNGNLAALDTDKMKPGDVDVVGARYRADHPSNKYSIEVQIDLSPPFSEPVAKVAGPVLAVAAPTGANSVYVFIDCDADDYETFVVEGSSSSGPASHQYTVGELWDELGETVVCPGPVDIEVTGGAPIGGGLARLRFRADGPASGYQVKRDSLVATRSVANVTNKSFDLRCDHPKPWTITVDGTDGRSDSFDLDDLLDGLDPCAVEASSALVPVPVPVPVPGPGLVEDEVETFGVTVERVFFRDFAPAGGPSIQVNFGVVDGFDSPVVAGDVVSHQTWLSSTRQLIVWLDCGSVSSDSLRVRATGVSGVARYSSTVGRVMAERGGTVTCPNPPVTTVKDAE